MDERVTQALESEQTIDITTTGRKTGRPRRIEIWFHNLDGRRYITGRPRPRGWYANLLVNPKFTFHLKRSVKVDLAATAKPITSETEKRAILAKILRKQGSESELEAWVRGSPLVEVEFDEKTS